MELVVSSIVEHGTWIWTEDGVRLNHGGTYNIGSIETGMVKLSGPTGDGAHSIGEYMKLSKMGKKVLARLIDTQGARMGTKTFYTSIKRKAPGTSGWQKDETSNTANAYTEVLM